MIHGDTFDYRPIRLGWPWAPFQTFTVNTIGDGSCFIHSILFMINRLQDLAPSPLISSPEMRGFTSSSYRLISSFPSELHQNRTEYALEFRIRITRWLVALSDRDPNEVITTIRDHPDTIRMWFRGIFSDGTPRIKTTRLEAASVTEHFLRHVEDWQIFLNDSLISDPSTATSSFRERLPPDRQIEIYMKLQDILKRILEARQNVIRTGETFASSVLATPFIVPTLVETIAPAIEDEDKVLSVICTFLTTYNRTDASTYLGRCLKSVPYQKALQQFTMEIGSMVDIILNDVVYGNGEVWHDIHPAALLNTFTSRQQFEDLSMRSVFNETNQLVGNTGKQFFDVDPRVHKTEDGIPLAARVTDGPTVHPEVDSTIVNANPGINYFAYRDGDLLRRAQSGDLSLTYMIKILPTHEWIGDDYISLLSSLLRLNFYILSRGTHGDYMWLYRAFTDHEATFNVIVHYTGGHYEAMGVVTEDGMRYLHPLDSLFSQALYAWERETTVNGRSLRQEEWASLRIRPIINDRHSDSDASSTGTPRRGRSVSGSSSPSESASQRFLRSSPQSDLLRESNSSTPATEIRGSGRRALSDRSFFSRTPSDFTDNIAANSESEDTIQGDMVPRYRQDTI